MDVPDEKIDPQEENNETKPSTSNSNSEAFTGSPTTTKENDTTIPYQQETDHQPEDYEENTCTNKPDHKPPNRTETTRDNSEPEKIELEIEPKDHIDTESDEDQENEDSDNNPPIRNLRNREKRQKDYAALHQGGPLQTKRKNSTTKPMKKMKQAPTDNDLQKNIDNIQKELRKQREANEKQQEELTRTKNDLEAKNTKIQKMKQNLDKIKTEKQLINDQHEDTKQEKNGIKIKLDQIQSDNQRLRTKLETAETELEHTSQQLEQLKEENRYQKNEIRKLKMTNHDLAEQLVQAKNKNPTQQQKISFIGDSNMIMIHGYLEMENMEQYQLTKTFTIEEATAWAKTTKTTPDTLHIIMVGTNNIKRGETANQCITKYEELTKTLERRNIQYRIMQIPPSYRNFGRDTNFCSRETIKMNIKLAQQHKTISMEEIETDRSLIAHDGIHLTDGACMILSNIITQEHIMPPPNKDREIEYEDESLRITVQDTNNETPSPPRPSTSREEPTEITTEIITANKQAAARVIGRKGATIISIKETTGVEINRIECSEETSFIVKGNTKNVRQAIQLMESIIKSSTTDPTPQEKRNKICRYYAAGYCRFGNRCIFLHQSGPLDTSNHSPEQDHTEYPPKQATKQADRTENKGNRTRSKSRQRDTQNPYKHSQTTRKHAWRSDYEESSSPEHSPPTNRRDQSPTHHRGSPPRHRSDRYDPTPRNQRYPMRQPSPRRETPPRHHRSSRRTTPSRKESPDRQPSPRRETPPRNHRNSRRTTPSRNESPRRNTPSEKHTSHRNKHQDNSRSQTRTERPTSPHRKRPNTPEIRKHRREDTYQERSRSPINRLRHTSPPSRRTTSPDHMRHQRQDKEYNRPSSPPRTQRRMSPPRRRPNSPEDNRHYRQDTNEREMFRTFRDLMLKMKSHH